MTCIHSLDDAAYVLGALSPAEREAYERHLASCPDCRDNVADLAALPGLLGRLDAETAASLRADTAPRPPVTTPPPAETTVPALLAAAAAHRRRDRWRRLTVGLVAACLALVAGLSVAFVVTRDDPRHPAYVAMKEVTDHAPVSAELALTDTPVGTRIDMRCHYDSGPDDDDHKTRWAVRLFALARTGTVEEIGSWTVAAGESPEIETISRFTRAELAAIELRRSDGTPLLRYNIS